MEKIEHFLFLGKISINVIFPLTVKKKRVFFATTCLQPYVILLLCIEKCKLKMADKIAKSRKLYPDTSIY